MGKNKRKVQRTKQQIIDAAKDKKKIQEQARTESFTAFMAMNLYVLNKEFGIGSSRASSFIDAFYKLNTDIVEDKISFNEIYDFIYKRLGIKIEQ